MQLIILNPVTTKMTLAFVGLKLVSALIKDMFYEGKDTSLSRI